jgi:hypothetical protein
MTIFKNIVLFIIVTSCISSWIFVANYFSDANMDHGNFFIFTYFIIFLLLISISGGVLWLCLNDSILNGKYRRKK